MYVIKHRRTGQYVRTIRTPQAGGSHSYTPDRKLALTWFTAVDAGEHVLKTERLVDLDEVPEDLEEAPEARDVRVVIEVTLLGGSTLETEVTVREGKNNAETRSHALHALQEEMDEAQRNAPSFGRSPRLHLSADGRVHGWVLVEEIAAVWAACVYTSDGRSIDDE